eukprot:15111-Prymnesium_polylepis.1
MGAPRVERERGTRQNGLAPPWNHGARATPAPRGARAPRSTALAAAAAATATVHGFILASVGVNSPGGITAARSC